MSTYFDYIMIPLQLLIVFFTIYYFTLSFFGLFGKKKETKIYDEVKTFALIVCAHNEERVIGQLVENLKLLNYDHKLYDIYVVADNCQDQTATVAAQAGALVQERFSDSGKGKGFALEWMFHRLFAMEKKYDAVCIFDADNLVHPNFLKEMNSRLCHGEKIIQGYLDTKNPEDSWVSAMFAISFWITNHIWHLAKYNIGLSCVLGGTGMCIDTEVLKRHGWGATCLTEDEEFTMKALMEGDDLILLGTVVVVGITTRQLEGCLVGFGPGVAEEDTIGKGSVHHLARQPQHGFIGHPVANMPQLLPLLDEGLDQRRVAMAQAIDGDTARQIDILPILLIPQPGSQAADWHKLRWRVGGYQHLIKPSPSHLFHLLSFLPLASEKIIIVFA